MLNLLFIDLETQGSDEKTTNATEIGALLLKEDGTVQNQLSTLVYDESYPPQTEEIVELTGITDEMLKRDGLSPVEAFQRLAPLLLSCDIAIAHNKKFDQGVYESSCKRLGVEIITPPRGWLCTVTEINWPKKYKCKKLAHLAYDHGILVHPDTLHRAINDVKLLADLILSKYKIPELLAYRDEPWVYLRADILGPWEGPGGDGGVGREQAKQRGYSWEKAWGTESPVFPKKWVKRVKASQLNAEKIAPFNVLEIKGVV